MKPGIGWLPRNAPHLKQSSTPEELMHSFMWFSTLVVSGNLSWAEVLESVGSLEEDGIFFCCFCSVSLSLVFSRCAELCSFIIDCLCVCCCLLPVLYLQSCWLPCTCLLYNPLLVVLFVHYWSQRWAIPAVIGLFFWLLEQGSCILADSTQNDTGFNHLSWICLDRRVIKCLLGLPGIPLTIVCRMKMLL